MNIYIRFINTLHIINFISNLFYKNLTKNSHEISSDSSFQLKILSIKIIVFII
jgi:hypothetical protein